MFGFSKALANLSVGVLVLRLGYTRTQLAGWVLGLAIPALAAGAGSGGSGWAAIMAGERSIGQLAVRLVGGLGAGAGHARPGGGGGIGRQRLGGHHGG